MPDELTMEMSSGTALKCPGCGEAWLHQERVEVFARDGEDTSTGLHADIDYGEGVTVDRSMDGNVSRSRDGIRISFWCEMCDVKPTLHIAQHEGNEVVSWEE